MGKLRTVRINPIQLKRARISRGLTIKDLSEKSGVSRQMISNYELGKTVPKAETTLRLINALKFPREFFSEKSELELHGPAFFRSQSASTKKIRDMQEVELSFQYKVYCVLKNYVNFPKVNLPQLIYKDPKTITDELIKTKAMETRQFWGLGKSEPVDNIINLVEANGIIVSKANISNEKLDAVSETIEGRPYILLTDNNESAVRRRFNIAHELGHIILHNGIESIHDYTDHDLKKIIENQANLFASSFLMPDFAFEKSLLSTSLDFFVSLKKYWQVSIQSMIYKTYDLHLISDDQRLYLNKKISWNKWRKREPLDDYIEIEKPELFKNVFNMIVENDVVKKIDLIKMIALPKDDIESFLDIKVSDSEIRQVPNLKLIK